MNLKSTSLGRQWGCGLKINGARLKPHQSRANEGRVIARASRLPVFPLSTPATIKAARFGTLAAERPSNYRDAAEPVTCKIICVPESNFTLRPAELITEPCALPAVAVLRATPCIPTTPRVAELMAPFAAMPVA
jgi:hypothetical protein